MHPQCGGSKPLSCQADLAVTWVLVKGCNLSYNNKGAILFAIHSYYDNLNNKSPATGALRGNGREAAGMNPHSTASGDSP